MYCNRRRSLLSNQSVINTQHHSIPIIFYIIIMVYLILSNRYPEESHRKSYIKTAGPHAYNVSPFHKPLAASASDDEWKIILKVIRDNFDDTNSSNILHDKSSLRPLRPNDDNYEAFVGPKWRPPPPSPHSIDLEIENRQRMATPGLSSLLGQNDDDPTTPYPHYDRCAYCTKPATYQCSQCKIVKYCSRNPCQASHWKKIHKASCVNACPFSLWECLQGNDGFYVTSEECLALQSALLKGLSQENTTTGTKDHNIIQCFAAYFCVTAELGGCFVL